MTELWRRIDDAQEETKKSVSFFSTRGDVSWSTSKGTYRCYFGSSCQVSELFSQHNSIQQCLCGNMHQRIRSAIMLFVSSNVGRLWKGRGVIMRTWGSGPPRRGRDSCDSSFWCILCANTFPTWAQLGAHVGCQNGELMLTDRLRIARKGHQR